MITHFPQEFFPLTCLKRINKKLNDSSDDDEGKHKKKTQDKKQKKKLFNKKGKDRQAYIVSE